MHNCPVCGYSNRRGDQFYNHTCVENGIIYNLQDKYEPVYDFLLENPGSDMRSIQEITQISMSRTQIYIQVLREFGIVIRKRVSNYEGYGPYYIYFLNEEIKHYGKEQGKILSEN